MCGVCRARFGCPPCGPRVRLPRFASPVLRPHRPPPPPPTLLPAAPGGRGWVAHTLHAHKPHAHFTHIPHPHTPHPSPHEFAQIFFYRIRTILPDPNYSVGSETAVWIIRIIRLFCTESCRLNDCKNHTTVGLLIKSFNSFCKRLTLKRDLKNDFSLCYKRFMISKMGFFVRIRLNLTV